MGSISLNSAGVIATAPLFSNLSLVVADGDRVGLVAGNGGGKTTLLRCIAGTQQPTSGEIVRSRGLRIGFGYAPLAVAEAVDRIRLPFNVSVPGLEAATAALSDEAHQTASRELIAAWKPRLTQAIRGFGLEVLPSAGNFVLVIFKGPEEATAANDYLNSKGIIVRPVGGYGLPQALRITIGTEDQNRAVIDALSEFAAG